MGQVNSLGMFPGRNAARMARNAKPKKCLAIVPGLSLELEFPQTSTSGGDDNPSRIKTTGKSFGILGLLLMGSNTRIQAMVDFAVECQLQLRRLTSHSTDCNETLTDSRQGSSLE